MNSRDKQGSSLPPLKDSIRRIGSSIVETASTSSSRRSKDVSFPSIASPKSPGPTTNSRAKRRPSNLANVSLTDYRRKSFSNTSKKSKSRRNRNNDVDSNIDIPENSVALGHHYANDLLTQRLPQCMAEIVANRPSDPIQFMSEYLYHNEEAKRFNHAVNESRHNFVRATRAIAEEKNRKSKELNFVRERMETMKLILHNKDLLQTKLEREKEEEKKRSEAIFARFKERKKEILKAKVDGMISRGEARPKAIKIMPNPNLKILEKDEAEEAEAEELEAKEAEATEDEIFKGASPKRRISRKTREEGRESGESGESGESSWNSSMTDLLSSSSNYVKNGEVSGKRRRGKKKARHGVEKVISSSLENKTESDVENDPDTAVNRRTKTALGNITESEHENYQSRPGKQRKKPKNRNKIRELDSNPDFFLEGLEIIRKQSFLNELPNDSAFKSMILLEEGSEKEQEGSEKEQEGEINVEENGKIYQSGQNSKRAKKKTVKVKGARSSSDLGTRSMSVGTSITKRNRKSLRKQSQIPIKPLEEEGDIGVIHKSQRRLSRMGSTVSLRSLSDTRARSSSRMSTSSTLLARSPSKRRRSTMQTSLNYTDLPMIDLSTSTTDSQQNSYNEEFRKLSEKARKLKNVFTMIRNLKTEKNHLKQSMPVPFWMVIPKANEGSVKEELENDERPCISDLYDDLYTVCVQDPDIDYKWRGFERMDLIDYDFPNVIAIRKCNNQTRYLLHMTTSTFFQRLSNIEQ